MADLKKVIKGLEQHMEMSCLSKIEQLQPILCPYFREYDCITKLCRDALELLKEQEQTFPTWRLGIPYCNNCGARFSRGYKYCPDCGRVVKWE